METFFKIYQEELEKAVRDYPQEYGWPIGNVPRVVELMRQGVRDNNFHKGGRAFKATCKRLGIPHTYKAIYAFIANHE